jgi:hypothetical protein
MELWNSAEKVKDERQRTVKTTIQIFFMANPHLVFSHYLK